MVVHTAAPMAPWLKRAWIDEFGPDHIWEAYGATEGLARTWIGGREWLERPGSVGKPTGGARIRILGPNGEDLPPGDRGRNLRDAAGRSGLELPLHRRRAARDRTMAGNRSATSAMLDADGYLYLADRRTDLIITGGVNIWPAEVEAALLRHPAISLLRGRRAHPTKISASASMRSSRPTNSTLDLDDLRAFLAGHLSRDKHPRSLDIQHMRRCATTPARCARPLMLRGTPT